MLLCPRLARSALRDFPVLFATSRITLSMIIYVHRGKQKNHFHMTWRQRKLSPSLPQKRSKLPRLPLYVFLLLSFPCYRQVSLARALSARKFLLSRALLVHLSEFYYDLLPIFTPARAYWLHKPLSLTKIVGSVSFEHRY